MRRIDIDTALLRCFVAVVDAGGFTAAGDKTGLTQSGVSVRIRRLEQQLQVQLLHRTSRAFELTPQGDILLGYAKRLLSLNDEMVERLTESDLSGRLRIGVAEYLAPLTLHRILHRFRSHYPQIRLEVVIGLGQNLAPEFERGDLDLAVAGADAINKDGEPLFEEEMNWVSGPNWFPGKDDVVKLITLPAPCRFRLAAINSLEAQGRHWEVSLVCSSVSGVQQGLRAGFGLSVLPMSSIPADLRQTRPIEYFGPLPRHRIHAFRKASNPMVERFLDYLTDELAGEHSFIPLHGRTAEVMQTDERNILALEPALR